MIWLEISVIAILSIYTLIILVSIFVLLFPERETDLSSFIPTKKVSILIPFRNEAQNIMHCLQGISLQDYPLELTELILINDDSTDHSKQLVADFLRNKNISYKLIDLKEHQLSGKKNAIEFGILQSSGSIIVTRDADTFTKNSKWLKAIVFQLQNADLVLVPVILSGSSFIQSFQQFENIAIICMGYAFAKINLPFVCSGANLAYKKESFLKANTYQNNKHIASGDDMFLLQSFIDNGFLISPAKNSNTIVYTNAEESLSSFINQRIRWASKAKNLHLKTAWLMGLLLLLSNLILLFMGISAFFGGINYKFCLFALIYKCIIEFLLLFLGKFMYRQKFNFTYYIPAFIANIFYVPMVSVASIIVKSKWKGRKQGV